MTIPEEIAAAEQRMQIKLTNSQKDWVEAWLEGRQVPPAARGVGKSYAYKVYLSVRAKRTN